MSESNLLALGKVGYVFSQIFRWTLILLIITLFGVGTSGIGVLLGVIIVYAVKGVIPFNTSCYKELRTWLNSGLTTSHFIVKIKQKLIFNRIVIFVLIVLFLLFQFSINSDETLLNVILFTPFVGMAAFQIWHCKKTAKFVEINSKAAIQ